MKKLFTITLGLVFLAGTVSAAAPKKGNPRQEPSKNVKEKQLPGKQAPEKQQKGGKQSQPKA